MKVRPLNDTSYIIGGALLGAAAMYFMDPDVGGRRRRRVAAAAEGAYDHARSAVGDHLHDVSHRLKHLAQNVAEQVGTMRQHTSGSAQALAEEARKIAGRLTDEALGLAQENQASAAAYGHQAADLGHRLWERARDIGSSLGHLTESIAGQAHDVGEDLSSRAGNWRRQLSKRAADAQSRAHSLLSHEEEHQGVGAAAVMLTAVGCCAVGAGIMYFMDPLHGRKRRDQFWKQTSGWVCSAGSLMRLTGRNLAERVRETTGDVLSIGSRGVDGRQLLDDIRGRIGHLIANPNDVQFMTETDGSVTVTGYVTRDELAALLTRLHDIPGVNHIINRISIREPSVVRSPENSPVAVAN